MIKARLEQRAAKTVGAGLIFVALAGAVSGAAEAVEQLGDIPRSHGQVTLRLLTTGTPETPGTVVISTALRTLDLVVSPGKVARYSIGVARDGFAWTGVVRVGRKIEWPEWRPPADMRRRDPNLPELLPPGPYNPLGARAIYLFQDGRDTLYRIHGTNDATSIGDFVSSGCFRMTNADVLDLYDHIRIGAKVIVH